LKIILGTEYQLHFPAAAAATTDLHSNIPMKQQRQSQN